MINSSLLHKAHYGEPIKNIITLLSICGVFLLNSLHAHKLATDDSVEIERNTNNKRSAIGSKFNVISFGDDVYVWVLEKEREIQQVKLSRNSGIPLETSFFIDTSYIQKKNTIGPARSTSIFFDSAATPGGGLH